MGQADHALNSSLRVGIVGLGFMGRVHYNTYQKLSAVQVVAIADADPKRAAGDLSGGWGNLATDASNQLPMDRIRGTTDYRELLRWDDVDVVDVCLPTPTHVEVVPEVLASGKHVLCEKPLARTSAEARRIADAAAKARGLFMPAMCMRFWGEWAWLKRAADERRYGRLLSANFQRVGSIPAGWYANGALSGGALLDLHVHDTDFVYHLLGKPAAVFSRGHRGKSGEIDHVVTQYVYGGGPDAPTATAEGSWASAEGFGFRMRYTVHFEQATADFDLFGTPSTLMLAAGGKKEPVEFEKHDGYVGEIGYFLDCVRNGTKPTRVTAEDGVVGLQIIEAERRSIESGRVEAV